MDNLDSSMLPLKSKHATDETIEEDAQSSTTSNAVAGECFACCHLCLHVLNSIRGVVMLTFINTIL